MALFTYPSSSVTIPGAATEAKQDVIIAELQDIDTNTATNATETTLSALNAKVTAVDTGNVTVNSVTPQDFLDVGLLDSSSTNIPTAGVQVVASLAANITEIEIVEDIGEFMTLTDGSDNVLAYLPLGGGRVKVSISSGTALKLASLTGGSISLGSIAINFLG